MDSPKSKLPSPDDFTALVPGWSHYLGVCLRSTGGYEHVIGLDGGHSSSVGGILD